MARHGVARARGDVELDATGGRAERQAGVGERAARVGLVVGEAGLDRRDGGTSVGLGGGVLALLLLTKEGRQGDGGEDADDENDDEKLDQCEALLVIAQLAQHSILLGSICSDKPAPLVPPVRQLGFLVLRSVALRPTLASGLPLASEGIWPTYPSGYRVAVPWF